MKSNKKLYIAAAVFATLFICAFFGFGLDFADKNDSRADKAEMGCLTIGGQFGYFYNKEYKAVLDADGIYYASWYYSENGQINGSKTKDDKIADGDNEPYDAEVYVVVQRSDGNDGAKKAVGVWKERTANSRAVTDEYTVTNGGVEYQVYDCKKKEAYDSKTGNSEADNPYIYEIAAFAVHGEYAISVELICSEDFYAKRRKALEDFLENIYFKK